MRVASPDEDGAELGSVSLPRFLFEWFETSRDESWTVADLGMLAAMLFQFENRVSRFTDARFDDEDGEAVLVARIRRYAWRRQPWSRRRYEEPPVGTEVLLGDGLVEVHVGGRTWQTVAAH